MTRILVVTILALALHVPAVLAADQAPAPYPKADLSKAYTPTLGDILALTTSGLLTSLRSIALPTLTAYDRETGKILIAVYGKRPSLDVAKKTLDEVRTVMEPMAEVVGSVHQVTLGAHDFEYAYVESGTGKMLVTWIDGKYALGEE